jgi:hypothetical protein
LIFFTRFNFQNCLKQKMKITKILLSTLSAAALAFTFSCSNAGNTATNNSAANNANKANIVVANSNQTTTNNTAPVSTTTPNVNNANVSKKPGAESLQTIDEQTVDGELQQGKTESLILYVGEESGDYAAYCFANDSDAGRAILAACKDKDQCEVVGEIGEGSCKVPGLEADLSDSGRITKVKSAKKLPAKK